MAQQVQMKICHQKWEYFQELLNQHKRKLKEKNFSIRKHVLQYDDVMNTQRGIIYKQRKQVLDGEYSRKYITHMINSVAEETIQEYVGNGEDVNKEGLLQEIKTIFNVNDLETLSKAFKCSRNNR